MGFWGGLSCGIVKNSHSFPTVMIPGLAFQRLNGSPPGDFKAFLGFWFLSCLMSDAALCLCPLHSLPLVPADKKACLLLHPILCAMMSKEKRSNPFPQVSGTPRVASLDPVRQGCCRPVFCAQSLKNTDLVKIKEAETNQHF